MFLLTEWHGEKGEEKVLTCIGMREAFKYVDEHINDERYPKTFRWQIHAIGDVMIERA